MSDTIIHTAAPLPLDRLPEGAAQPQLPDQARISAIGIEDGTGGPLAWAVLRQRRTAEVIQIVGWSAPAELSPALADGILADASARSAALLRATPDQAQAIAALGLEDTGRGYAQRWLGDPIPLVHPVGRYNQSTGFTCGPVSLLSAMGPEVTRHDEIALWREATSVVSLNGPGGCDPYGMLLAAEKRGLRAELFFDAPGPILLDRVQSEEKRELVTFVQNAFKESVAEKGLPVTRDRLGLPALSAAVEGGAMVILLIDQILTHDHHAPHWVLVHAAKDGLFLVNDPWLEPRDRETLADVDCIPIRGETLYRMGAWGDPARHAALILR
ncbi:peptidase C39 family protein [Chachezhania antarctica]|uniref:peptidase C39 family protein n=1 Tax=Chachezhania antarctica TaxID=2340860 RepID=UPI0013CEFEBB|nr:peptidase C39 family protein [Chachezhania antarctica]